LCHVLGLLRADLIDSTNALASLSVIISGGSGALSECTFSIVDRVSFSQSALSLNRSQTWVADISPLQHGHTTSGSFDTTDISCADIRGSKIDSLRDSFILKGSAFRFSFLWDVSVGEGDTRA
jgi:hypothetical protein